jgi:hypothetical protein
MGQSKKFRVRDQFLVELVAEYDHVLELRRQRLLVGNAAVPDLRFPHEIESAPLNHRCSAVGGVGPEEDRRAKDPLECAYQPAILLSGSIPLQALQFAPTAESLV